MTASLSIPITPVPCPPLTTHIIVFGGTFDPPHQGHVQLTVAAREAIDANAALLFVPAAVSPFKVGVATTPATHRSAMLHLAIASVSNASVWTDEIDRASASPTLPSYTIDTITRLQSQLPHTRITLLIGADQAVSFHKWREAPHLLPHVRVLLREPFTAGPALITALRATQAWTDEQIAAWQARTVSLAQPLHPARSTTIRQRIAAHGLTDIPSTWLCPAVTQYILDHQLYC